VVRVGQGIFRCGVVLPEATRKTLPQGQRGVRLLNDERLTENSERASYSPCDRWGQWEELTMKTTILAYVIALGGVALIVLGFWRLYILITERVAELRLRDYIPTIQTIAVGFGLIGLAQALRLLLVIFGATDASLRALLA
jgi:hypothetical protein